MDKHVLDVSLSMPFGNLYRERHVLVIVQDRDGLLVTGLKSNFYPQGISRLLGGGVDQTETPEEAAKRELFEEIGATVSSVEPVAEVVITARTSEQTFYLTTYLYFATIDNRFKAGDDVTSLKRLTVDQLFDLASKYENLRDDDVYVNGEYKHSWGDYGKVYGPIHRIAAEYVKRRSLTQ
jgi:8-oxo-dGTP pyrophosphatase MutT (NUDIX family)